MASQPNNPVAVIRQNLNALAPEFKAALPAHVSVEKFSRVAMTAIQNNPQLQDADRRSLFGAIVRLAQDGLLPDGREAALVMFGNKAQAMPMIAGVLKKIRQSGDVAKISAQVVYENDHFLVKYGFDEDVEHTPPPLDKPRGKAIGAYATAVLKDGERMLEVMSLEEIEKVRAVSRAAKNGPWVQWWGEMARKTVMRRLSKRLPMSTDLEDEVFSRDETLAHVDAPTLHIVAEQPAASRLDALEHQIAEEGEYSETGDSDPREGRSEAEHGDQHDDSDGGFGGPIEDDVEEAPAWVAKRDDFIRLIENATDLRALKAVDDEMQKHIVAFPDEVADRLNATVATKRRVLSKA